MSWKPCYFLWGKTTAVTLSVTVIDLREKYLSRSRLSILIDGDSHILVDKQNSSGSAPPPLLGWHRPSLYFLQNGSTTLQTTTFLKGPGSRSYLALLASNHLHRRCVRATASATLSPVYSPAAHEPIGQQIRGEPTQESHFSDPRYLKRRHYRQKVISL